MGDNLGEPGDHKLTPPDRHNQVFTELGFEAVALAYATTAQTDEGREVFLCLKKPWQEELPGTATDAERQAASKVSQIFEHYHDKSEEKRIETQAAIAKELGHELYAKNGWIFSDYFPTSFGMNQPTLTTYV